ncbi:MAG: hypothetical protein IIU55_01310 [Paludibacteraceae bacterium]|nr:hypothetical protein [Paludibacteraceae bacterium]
MSFNKELFDKAIEQFDVNAAKERLAELNIKREEFVKHFTPEYIAVMPIDEYVIGWGKTDKLNFSYDLEWTLSGLGSFRGGSSAKFGVWYNKEKKTYLHLKKYADYNVAYNDVRQNILSLLDAGGQDNIQSIIDNPLSLTFKGKILSVYYPTKYINIFKDEHLDFFLDGFGVETDVDTEEEKRMLLAEVKKKYSVFNDWSLQLFSKFLYEAYPGHPDRQDLATSKTISTDSCLEYPIANYITKDDSREFTLDELKQIVLNLRASGLEKNMALHLFGILYAKQIGNLYGRIAKEALASDTLHIEIQKGIKLGNFLREKISDIAFPILQVPSEEKYTNYLRALRTKPFMLLAGISGTGKSRLVRELAFKSCPNIDDLQADKTTPGNYLMIEVKPNWHDSTEILGYYSNISKKYQFTKFIHFLVKAKKYPKVPFFVCLDEMNLAPVEQYFAEFLSVIETRKKNDNAIVTGTLVEAQRMRELEGWTEGDLTLPDNVFIIGTVNMDDTTHQFSRKVIDRAMTIEMNGDKLANMFGRSGDLCYLDEGVWPLESFKAVHVCADEMLKELKLDQADTLKQGLVNKLDAINICLKNTPFQVSYRVLNEMCVYAGVLLSEGLTIDAAIAQAVDQITLMKILPRIEGDEDMFVVDKQNKNRLEMMMELFDENSESYKKLEEMNNRLDSGFTRFWP